MEENIFIVESFLKNKKMLLKHPVWVSEQTLQAIENLINKYKEQEEGNNILNGTIKSLIKLGEEHMEMINLMAKDISENKLNEDICRQVKDPKNEECYAYQYDENACKDCVIEYYEKKARTSNEIIR